MVRYLWRGPALVSNQRSQPLTRRLIETSYKERKHDEVYISINIFLFMFSIYEHG
ncbi:hypothetical protein SAMN05660420_03409 [Desulfuromusa kysingii]|uniref:Uncharacterized protein n=1 Tax=Desulfuromusa kysingii TaxID=37625 RepID=A0A1H4EJ98_9BACT|nr:hypothetical protein SAMN05660420_03409 [Desulfuromusa kysingii]